ncbi:Clavaminate synthase-like protein [Lindgomyces ingoldianus]|uniref:Clavaminate synthase-like protein n=1 Tax=Lindgomyces ingoldianus TaxID=673940 RepID=A0ACB6RDS2_9PLEO|nr:Clavaminate synthase-like protein [Lindgomyces ingoldianus]KAF2477389.1 Clavaminate synthase-like protein [Lindgomyces ingoldianus]
MADKGGANSPLKLPILDLSKANNPIQKQRLLEQLHDALFNVGFLYIKNHGVDLETISNLVSLLPALFGQPAEAKAALSKLNSPHFLGYSGYAEEITLGEKDLREQFDLATELPVVWDPTPTGYSEKGNSTSGRDFSHLYWRLRGPNQWPSEEHVPGFRRAFTEYHDALQALSYRFVHLVEAAFGIPVGTFDAFFRPTPVHDVVPTFVPAQHRVKLVKYPPIPSSGDGVRGQGVGAHKDSSGWLTFLYQVGQEEGLEVLCANGEWIAAPPVDGTLVVNFGNAFEAATQGAVKATVHRVLAPKSKASPRYSIPFFQGLPLDLTISEIQSYIPESVRKLRRDSANPNLQENVSSFQDPRWDNLGESQLRKWIRSHENVARKWYGSRVTAFYLQ